MADKPTPLTNQEFAEAVGCHHSMASRIRAGVRLPGIELTERIGEVYGIPIRTLLDARKKGPEAFGELVDRRIYQRGLRPKVAA